MTSYLTQQLARDRDRERSLRVLATSRVRIAREARARRRLSDRRERPLAA